MRSRTCTCLAWQGAGAGGGPPVPSGPSRPARPLPKDMSGCPRGRHPSLGQPILAGVIHKISRHRGGRAHAKWRWQVTCRGACDGPRRPFIPDSRLAQAPRHLLGSRSVDSGQESRPEGSGMSRSKHSRVVDGHFVRVPPAFLKRCSIFLF